MKTKGAFGPLHFQMIGPGKYDEACTSVRETAQAQGVILIVFGGNKGSGFSCQAPLEIQLHLPQILRHVADLIEADFQNKGFEE